MPSRPRFLGLSLATIGVTALIFAFDYRAYYADMARLGFHRHLVLPVRLHDAGALIQFAVLGVRLYFPLGFAALFARQPLVRALRALSIAAALC